MTTRQADKLIKTAERVTVRDTFYNETFSVQFTSRTRTTINGVSDNGHVGTYERATLEVVALPAKIS